MDKNKKTRNFSDRPGLHAHRVAGGHRDPVFARAVTSGMHVKVLLERGDDGYYVAHCRSLKSCWSQGKTRDEAIQNIRDAIELYLEPSPEQQ